MQTENPNEIKQTWITILRCLLRKVQIGISNTNHNQGLEKGWHFHERVFFPLYNPKSLYSNRERHTPLIQACVYVCVHVLKKRHIMHTFIKQCPLSLSASHQNTCALTQTHTQTHTNLHVYTSATIQSLSNKEGTDASSGSVGGGHALCQCAMGRSWHKHLSTITSSAVSKCEEMQKECIPTSSREAADAKYDNMKSEISVKKKKKKGLFFLL